MKAYSFSFEVVQTIFQNNKKCPSYHSHALNKNMHSKKTKKESILIGHFLEATQANWVKFFWDT